MALTSLRRRATTTVSALALAAAALVLPGAGTAHASVDLVTCPLGTETISYSPGLKYPSTPAPNVSLSATGTVGPCVSLDLNHTAGAVTFNGSGPLNCLGGNSSGTGKIDWVNAGTTDSKFNFTGGVSLRPNGITVLVLTGQVTSGDYAGKTVINTITLLSTDITACLSPTGLTSSAGPITITIL
ncbi:hypothetical protein ACIQM4_26260 [Streptomyces sp. NPDC091272]|uniref:hypothetical protein n=1 Tax=Streptomyces sp. NPDC091272 TaxID=3365981 RepID=UPI00381D3B07